MADITSTQQTVPSDAEWIDEFIPRKVKLLASTKVKDFIGSHLLTTPGFCYSRVKKFVVQLASFANFAGELHAFFVKNHNPRFKELDLVSEDGSDAVIRFYNNSKDRETLCSIPDYKANYDRNWALIQNDEIFFFELDEFQNILEPRFKKKVFCDKNGSIIATRCIELDSRGEARITFEVEKYNHTLSFTMIIPNDSERKKLVEAYSVSIIQNLISGNNTDRATYASANRSVYSYYSVNKAMLDRVCDDFIVSTYDNVSDFCTSKLVVVKGKVSSFMLPDKDGNKITRFANKDWKLVGPLLSAQRKTKESSASEGSTTKKINFSLKTEELSETEINKVPSLPDIRDYVERFIETNLKFAFRDNYD